MSEDNIDEMAANSIEDPVEDSAVNSNRYFDEGSNENSAENFNDNPNENYVESGPKKRLAAISMVFWGLLIVFIDINIETNFGPFDVFNDFLGLLIIIIGLYNLRKLSNLFLKSLYFAQSYLAWMIFVAVFSFSLYTNHTGFVITANLIEFALFALMLYCLLNGLAQLAQNQYLHKLSGKLKLAFSMYLFSIVLVAAALFVPVFFLVIFVLFVLLFIYILIQVRSSYNQIFVICPKQVGSGGKQLLKVFAAAAVFVLLPIVSGVGIIAVSESSQVHTASYSPTDLPGSTAEVAEIRDKMISLGFASHVVQDMPDSEIQNYQGLVNVQFSHYTEYCDGSRFMVSQYVSGFGTDEYRLLFYYQWLDNPQPAHAETVGIKLFGEFFEHGNIFSLNLYDTRNGGTYYAEDVSRNEDFLNRHTAKKFKLINQNEANNYRGFLSFSVKYRSDSLIKQNVFYYIRQRTVLNHKGSDILYLYDNAFDGAFPFDFSFDSAFSSYSYNEPLIVFNENWLINEYTFWANVEW